MSDNDLALLMAAIVFCWCVFIVAYVMTKGE